MSAPPTDAREAGAPRAPRAPALRASGLSFRYGSGALALEDLTVEVPHGAVGLVGANGAGKTTLFKLMLGLLRPSAGALWVCGVPVAQDPLRARARLGFMPEHDCLPPEQAAADVVAHLGELSGLPPGASRRRASEALDLVGLDEARFRPIEGFSTGMRQRVKLAQALVADPELLLLDEPTAGLDPTGRTAMLELIRRLAGLGISVVMSTHLLDDVQQVCDYVVMLDGGRLVEAGPTAALLRGSGSLRVDVGQPGGADLLAEALAERGLAVARPRPGVLEVPAGRHPPYDLVRDLVADLGLPLHALSAGHASLDEVFLERANRQP